MQKIRLGIVGYGNISRGCIAAIKENPDMELAVIFTRRNPRDIVVEGVKSDSLTNISAYKGKVDVMLLCLGSATDLPELGAKIAKEFCTVDSYDNHSKMLDYLSDVNTAATSTVAVVGTGWDPGLFSLSRISMETMLPNGKNYTFWGKGVSQGHSDAVRRVQGVKRGIQYTIPIENALNIVRGGSNEELSKRQTHLRQCFVVAHEGADRAAIEKAIVTMPDYFQPYNTEVNFIDEEEFERNHTNMPHGGFVIRSGKTAGKNGAVIEYSLKLGSNPEFTASVMVAYARAAKRLFDAEKFGAHTVFDIPPVLLSPKTREKLIEEML